MRRRKIILQLHHASEYGSEMPEEVGLADLETSDACSEPNTEVRPSIEQESIPVTSAETALDVSRTQTQSTSEPVSSESVTVSEPSFENTSANTEVAVPRKPATLKVTFGRRKPTSLAPVPSTVPGLLRYLKSTPQVNWLFTGESLPIRGEQRNRSDEGESLLVSSLAAYLRDVVGRREDTICSSETSQFRLQDLVRGFDKKIGKFSPQIVVINCGLTELQTRWESPVAFEHMFHKLVLRIRNEGAVPIIATPPWPCPSDSFHHTDELIRLEAIRACAEESAALLIDHWEHWENCSDNDWYTSDRQMLSERGVQEIVVEFAKALKLDQLAELKV